jgi:hypothetical protein
MKLRYNHNHIHKLTIILYTYEDCTLTTGKNDGITGKKKVHFNVLSVSVQHLLGKTVFSSAMLTWRCFLRPDALPDTNTRAVSHE